MAGVGLRQPAGLRLTRGLDLRTAKPISLETPQGHLEGLHWPAPAGPKVLCLHGWLDNAASFLPLAGHLQEIDLVAIDLPGHGLSEHRHAHSRYHFVDYLWDVDAALTALGWKQCHLAGHSMGASVACLFASGLPESVLSLTMLDSLGPWTGEVPDSGKRLRKSLHEMRQRPRTSKTYESIDAMIKARRRHSDLSYEAARTLCERSARRINDHFVWRTDQRLSWTSPLVITEEQAISCLEGIEATTLSILAMPHSMFSSASRLEKRRDAIGNCHIETIEGHHHVHMDQPESIANYMKPFILGNHEP
jgi:pimeloyl-ACP methyl ester carboxylesterase